MASTEFLAATVAAVMRSGMLPATLDGLDVATRRQVEREAERKSITPAAHYSALLLEREENLRQEDRVAEMVQEIRSRR
jgi:hypothetical protein